MKLQKNCWDVVYLERLELACDISKSADLAIIVMDVGKAHLCLVSGHMTREKAKIEQNIPHKRGGTGTTQYEKSINRFYNAIYTSIINHIDFNIIKVVILASTAILKDEVYDYIFTEALRTENKVIQSNKNKFMKVHVTNGHKGSIQEILQNETVLKSIGDLKAVKDVQLLQQFFRMIDTDPNRAYYGYNQVKRADESKAIDTLLITDTLFRNPDINERKRYVDLVESVKESNGNVCIFSSQHSSGEQLDQVYISLIYINMYK